MLLDARFRGHDSGETTDFFSELLRRHNCFSPTRPRLPRSEIVMLDTASAEKVFD
jgi:hypothetical protein